MNIANFRPFDGPVSARGFRCVGKFAVDVTPDFRIFDWQLIETPTGTYQAYAPAGKTTANIISTSPDTRRELAAAVVAIMKRAQNERAE